MRDETAPPTAPDRTSTGTPTACDPPAEAAAPLPRSELFRRWFEATQLSPTFGLFKRNLDTGVVSWDETMYGLWGLAIGTAPPALDQLFERVVAEDRTTLALAWDQSLRSTAPAVAVYRVPCADGTTRWLQSEWRVLANEAGQRVAIGSTRDVSPTMATRRRTDQARVALELAVRLAGVGLLREDIRSGDVQLDGAAAHMFGLPGAGTVSRLLLIARVHRDDRRRLARSLARVRRGEATASESEYRVVHEDGRELHLLARRRLERDDDGKPSAVIGAVIDLTDLRMAQHRERQLGESRDIALGMAHLGMWELDAPDGVLHADATLRQMLGWHGEPAAGSGIECWLDSVHPDDRDRVAADWARIRDGTDLQLAHSFRVRRPNGTVRWLHATCSRIRRADRTLGGVRGICEDVTERRELEDDLRSQRQLMDATQRLAVVGSWRRDIVSDEVWWSPVLYRIFRRDPALGPPTADERQHLFTPQSWRALAASLETSRAQRRAAELELEIVRGDGSHGRVRSWHEFEDDGPDGKSAYRGCAQDITELVQMRSATAAAHDRLQALFDSALNGITLADHEGRYVDANPAACALLGYTLDELKQRRSADLLAAGNDPGTAEAWARPFERPRHSGQVRLRCREGQVIVAEFAAVAHIQPDLHLCMLSDVTARVQAEAALREAQQRLRHLAMRQQDEFDAFRADLARDVHDQLGQTLGALKLEIDHLTSIVPATPHVTEATQRMRRLVQDGVAVVRDVSRALRPATLDLGLAPALRALGAEMSMRSDVDVVVEVPDRMPALADSTARSLYRIAQEALTNAARHADARQVSLQLSVAPMALALDIRDNGRGFDPARAAAGDGLGVLGMRERARQIGAQFALDSAVGAGTWVHVGLPWPVAVGK